MQKRLMLTSCGRLKCIGSDEVVTYCSHGVLREDTSFAGVDGIATFHCRGETDTAAVFLAHAVHREQTGFPLSEF